jgi:menaquinol-cytochrome c reductase iron-sulfur subunit
MDRRTLLLRFTQTIGLVVAGAVGIPGAIYALAPVFERRKGARWVPVGRVDDFKVGEVRKALVEIPRDDWMESLRQQAVYVWRAARDNFVVYSRKCTDLGCPVVFDEGSQWFFCPCHGGVFSKEGEPKAGPPKIPLHRFQVRLRDGAIEIDLDSIPPMT